MSEIRASPIDREKERSQNFVLRLYVETEDYNIDEILALLPKCFTQYAYCYHDRDFYDEDVAERNIKKGDRKKTHVHVYGKRSQCTINTVANILGISNRNIQVTHDRISAIQYLIHKNDPDKAQYFFEEVVTNFDCAKYLDDCCEENRIRQVLDFVTSSKRSIFDTCMFALESNCWSEFRRSYSIIRDIIAERNNLHG